MPNWMLYGAIAFFTVMLAGRLIAALMPQSRITRLLENGPRLRRAPGSRRRARAWQAATEEKARSL